MCRLGLTVSAGSATDSSLRRWADECVGWGGWDRPVVEAAKVERVDKDEVRKSRELREVEVSEAFSEGVESEVR